MYRFDEKSLTFVKIGCLVPALKMSFYAVIAILLLSLSLPSRKSFTESEVMIIVAKHNQFTEEKLTNVIQRMHFPFPYIVYAQALHETNYFKSSIFTENHNLFGMRSAVVRINTAKGTQNEHAYYDSWMESVYDYALYSATYLSSLKTEEEYYSYLEQSYAEDSNYVNKIKSIVENDKLKSKFK